MRISSARYEWQWTRRLPSGDSAERPDLRSPARGNSVGASLDLLVVLPGFLICLRAREGIADHELDAQPGHRVAARTRRRGACRHVFRILAEGELDPRHRALELDVLRSRLAPSQLDHL